VVVVGLDLDLDGPVGPLVVAVLDDVGDRLVDGQDDLVLLLAGEAALADQPLHEVPHQHEVLRVVRDDQPVF
jgi:hypothetical protein